MGYEIHAINEDGTSDMTRHFSIWDYRRCIAFSAYLGGHLTKEETLKEFIETADLQQFSRIQIDDDGNYINPVDNPEIISKVLEQKEKTELKEDKKTRFVMIEQFRDDDGTPYACGITLPPDMMNNIPDEAKEMILMSMVKQQLANEELILKLLVTASAKDTGKKVPYKTARQMAMAATDTGGILYEGNIARVLGYLLNEGILKTFLKFDSDKPPVGTKEDLAEITESWENIGAVSAFGGVWMQIATNGKFKIN